MCVKMLLKILFFIFYLTQLTSSIDEHTPNSCVEHKGFDPVKYNEKKNACSSNHRKISDFTSCMNEFIEELSPTHSCCDGYFEKDGDCIELCPGCENGECTSSHSCDCAINFGGKHCNETCQPGKFGTDCEHDCTKILDMHSNEEYDFCLCGDKASIEKSCEKICKCRHHCSPGYIGKECKEKCSDGYFGLFCGEKCRCYDKGTIKCNPENGECHCHETHFGPDCEFECDGVLNCTNLLRNDCTCSPTIDQKIEHLNKEKNTKIDELNERLNNEKFLFKLIILIVVVVLVIFIYRTQLKTKKLKNDLITMRYSSRDKDEFDNPMFSANLTNSKKTSKLDDLKDFLPKINFIDKLSFLTRKQQARTNQQDNEIAYPILVDANENQG